MPKDDRDPHHQQMANIQVAAGWVVLGLIAFTVIIRPDVQMVATLAGALGAYLGLRLVNRNSKK